MNEGFSGGSAVKRKPSWQWLKILVALTYVVFTMYLTAIFAGGGHFERHFTYFGFPEKKVGPSPLKELTVVDYSIKRDPNVLYFGPPTRYVWQNIIFNYLFWFVIWYLPPGVALWFLGKKKHQT